MSELQTAIDYLGRPAPVSLAEKPALPAGGSPLGIAAGPSAPSGVGATGTDGEGGGFGGGLDALSPEIATGGMVTTAPSGLMGGGTRGPLTPELLESIGAPMDPASMDSWMQDLLKGGKAAWDILNRLSGSSPETALNPEDFNLSGEGGGAVLNPADFNLSGEGGGPALNPDDFTLGKTSLNDPGLPNVAALPDAVRQSLAAMGLDPSGFSLGADAATSALDPSMFSLGGEGGGSVLSDTSGFNLGVDTALDAGGGAGAAGAGLGAAGSIVGYGMEAKKVLDILNSNMGSDQKAFELLGAAGKIVSTAFGGPLGGVAADFIHKYVSAPFVEAVFGEFGHSKEWNNFPRELSNTLILTENSNRELATTLAGANTPEEISSAIAKWKGSIGQRVGGFGAGSGEFDLPDLPGAGGNRHEGGVAADFGPISSGLRAMLASARAGAPPQERLAALRSGIIGGMSGVQKIAADPTGGTLTATEVAGWKQSLIDQTAGAHPELSAALSSGALSPLEAQGVLDALSPGTTAFVAPPSAALLAQFQPPPNQTIVSGGENPDYAITRDPNQSQGGNG